MTASERRATSSLAAIYALRMLGLFMILPVFAIYAEDLDGVTPLMVGVAISAYGLTQALLQIPFGAMSDRWGRKPVITFGLLLFCIGSIVAALADSIWGVALGRALQGSGAIAAAIMALAADLTREEHRTKAMAMIGTSIGMAFILALVAGPILAGWFGVRGIFWLTAGLALAGIWVLWRVVPNPVHSHFHRDAEPVPALIGQVLRNSDLLRLDAGILILHMILTANFVVLPLLLRDSLGMAPTVHWQFYLPVMLAALVLMIALVILAERKRRIIAVFIGAVICLGLAEMGVWLMSDSLAWVVFCLIALFAAFNTLEATLPSLVSRMAPSVSKGTAMGVYSTSQFMGAFLGGVIGGALHGFYGVEGVFLFCAMMAGLWLVLTLGMNSPPAQRSYVIHVGDIDEDQAVLMAVELRKVAGVTDAVVVVDEGAAYLKIDPELLDEAALDQFQTNGD